VHVVPTTTSDCCSNVADVFARWRGFYSWCYNIGFSRQGIKQQHAFTACCCLAVRHNIWMIWYCHVRRQWLLHNRQCGLQPQAYRIWQEAAAAAAHLRNSSGPVLLTECIAAAMPCRVAQLNVGTGGMLPIRVNSLPKQQQLTWIAAMLWQMQQPGWEQSTMDVLCIACSCRSSIISWCDNWYAGTCGPSEMVQLTANFRPTTNLATDGGSGTHCHCFSLPGQFGEACCSVGLTVSLNLPCIHSWGGYRHMQYGHQYSHPKGSGKEFGSGPEPWRFGMISNVFDRQCGLLGRICRAQLNCRLGLKDCQ